MNIKILGAAVSGLAAVFVVAGAAGAQTYTLGGAIQGVCILDGRQMAADSALGQAVEARLKQLDTQVVNELTPERTAIENEAKSLQAAAQAATTAEQRQPLAQREQALNNRANAYQQMAALRQAEMQATTQKALARINTEALPVVRQVAQQRSCALLLDSNSVLDANPAMDITAAVVTGLNAKISTITFERERLDTQAARPAQ